MVAAALLVGDDQEAHSFLIGGTGQRL